MYFSASCSFPTFRDVDGETLVAESELRIQFHRLEKLLPRLLVLALGLQGFQRRRILLTTSSEPLDMLRIANS